MILGWFKKKKEEEHIPFDPTNIKVNQMRKGSFFEYDLKTWEVIKWFEYDWGNNFFSDEYQIQSSLDTFYLYVEEGGEGMYCNIVKKIMVRSIEGDIPSYIKKFDTAPPDITYEGVKYFKEQDSAGFFRDTDNTEWSEFISWTYYDETGKKVLAVERWGEDSFEAAVGVVVKDYEISGIIMP